MINPPTSISLRKYSSSLTRLWLIPLKLLSIKQSRQIDSSSLLLKITISTSIDWAMVSSSVSLANRRIRPKARSVGIFTIWRSMKIEDQGMLDSGTLSSSKCLRRSKSRQLRRLNLQWQLWTSKLSKLLQRNKREGVLHKVPNLNKQSLKLHRMKKSQNLKKKSSVKTLSNRSTLKTLLTTWSSLRMKRMIRMVIW